MKINICVLFAYYISFAVALAQSPDFTYSREITGVAEAWHKVELPVDLFEKLNSNFSDLRIFGISDTQDTLEVPYLVKIHTGKSKSQAADFKIINRSADPTGHYFTFQMNEEILINQMKLNFADQNFDWLLKLEGSHDGNNWLRILDEYRIVSVKNEFTDYKFNTVNFPDSKYKYFKIKINSIKQPRLENAQIIKEDKIAPIFHQYQTKSIKIETDKKQKQTIVELTLHKRAPISSVKLAIESNVDYYRPVLFQYLVDSIATEKGWIQNYAHLHSATLSSTEESTFVFSSRQTARIKIIISNHDNEALSIHSAEALGYKHDLIARFPISDQFYLYYGNSRANHPKYDLLQFENKIPENLSLVTLNEEKLLQYPTIEDKIKWYEHSGVMWSIIGLIILLLAYFSIRMMRK